MDAEVIEKVAEQPAAIILEAANATGSPDRINVTWTGLANAEIGTCWRAVGGGTMFHNEESATVIWRDSQRVVVWYEWRYSCPSSNDHECEAKLMGFRL